MSHIHLYLNIASFTYCASESITLHSVSPEGFWLNHVCGDTDM